MKKRAALFALLLSLLAAIGHAETAYTLPQVIRQAEAGWHQSYRAHGRTITVDVTPLLPEAERFPVLYCSWKKDWDLVPPDEQKHNAEVNGQPHIAENRGDMFLVSKPSNGGELEWTVSANGRTVKLKPYRAYYPPFEQDKAYIPANETTLRELTEMTKEIMKGLDLDTTCLWKEPTEVGTHSFYENNDKENPLAPGIAFISWDQAFRGIPLVSDLQFGKNIHTVIHLSYQNPDLCSWSFSLWNIEREVAPDVPLCAFDKVIKTLEKEIQDGRLRAVFEIKLGYGLFNEDGVPYAYSESLPKLQRRYYLKPVWRVHGIWVRSAKSSTKDIVYGDEAGYRDVRNSAHQAFITLDAQTGEILTNTNTGKEVPIEQTYYDGYLSWKDMGGKPE
ncbi:MAG: hypothetical protein ACOX7B_03180 [Christensenellales bacterium]|jgi:hypothetical protein